MKKKLTVFLSSFLLLAVSFLLFIYAFLNPSRMIYYILSGLALAAFCIVNRLAEKKIKCPDGYNLIQAYTFYLKCEKKGVSVKNTKLKDSDIQVISSVASGYDYCEDFSEEQIKTLYQFGRDVAITLKLKERKN